LPLKKMYVRVETKCHWLDQAALTTVVRHNLQSLAAGSGSSEQIQLPEFLYLNLCITSIKTNIWIHVPSHTITNLNRTVAIKAIKLH
jgi:hypothetical protein